MEKEIRLRNRLIGEGQPLFIVAECGVTCNYDLKTAKELIDVVGESGADAIKFIFWFPEEIMSDRSVVYSYETVAGAKSENMFEMLSKLRFTLDEWLELKGYADKRNVIMFSTVNSPSGIAFAEAIGLEAYKLSSWDFNYLPLWERISKIGKPMIIDTGPVNLLEVAKVMQVMMQNDNYKSILVHCVHTKNPDEINMRSISYMQTAFNSLTGYSSNFMTSETDIMGITLGAVFLEKRLTLSRNLPGHHHVISMEPEEFKDWVKHMRDVEVALGDCELKPSQGDLTERKRWFRHIVANQNIPKGTKLTSDMLEGKRPEKGISPEYMEFFVGRVTKRDLKENEALSWSDV
ncbi:MAG: N-acetylneuraminate synthase family protein [Deltaproteobacteria bacterium]|jgi:N,N'-diacetyllegionaminate synthase